MAMTEQDEQRLSERGITLEQLRTFVCIAQEGGFGRASEVLARTQSTLSAGLKRLEEDVGCRLIERRQGHVIGLTDEGRRLLPAARDILQRTSRAIGALKTPSLEGRIALGVPDDFAIHNLHRVISLCLAENPGLRVEVTAASSSVLSHMMDEQRLDVVILKGIAGQPVVSSAERVIQVEPLYWVSAGAAHFDEMGEVPLATFMEGCVIRQSAVAALNAVGRPHYFAYVSGSFDNVKKAVASGLGVGILPQSALTDELVVLDEGNGVPTLPAIQLVLSASSSRALCERFAGYLGRALGE
ncbi:MULTISPECIES: LysR family transcriptional regulator [unclassified Halomonas]|uniref:LysR family transcriptional regulator n=1 Tax=unclassified Halomonas TaxID=2609666 RepID=UPI002076ABD4|nr:MULTISPECIES: LysR family transcriptional regulator [unclassified Halomonas]